MAGIRWLRWRGLVLILIAASAWPLHIFTVNLFGIVRPERVFGLVVLLVAVGVLLIWVLVHLGMDVEAAEGTAFAAVVFAMNGGPILRTLEELGYVVLLVCPILAGWLLTRLRGHLIMTALVWAAAVALASGPILTFLDSWNSRGGPSVVSDGGSVTVELSYRPDIFLVVLDGYPGRVAARQDGLDPGRVAIAPELGERGFQLPAFSWSSYWTTTLSIPSLMEMNYPVVDRRWRGSQTKLELQRMIAGDNALVEVLKVNGYRIHMVESGWSTASCGASIDVCVPSPLLDEATYLILRHTIVWPLIEKNPGPYALGTLAAFDWLLDHGPELSESESPDFVFMHVVSPHPPLLLTSDCSTDLSYDRTGGGFNLPGVSVETREEYLIQQMDCVDSLMISLADSVESDDIVIFVSDHGTDRRYQANPDNVDWDRATIVERMNNFLALRVPEGCAISDSVIVPNIFRLVLGCLSGSSVEQLPERMWINPMAELAPELVQKLMTMTPSPDPEVVEAGEGG